MNDISNDLRAGEIIQDTYRIDRLLGEGGMGATFAGHNIASDHPVAIKVISSAFANNKRAIDLFKREANLLRTIQHEAVVRYETTLQDGKGRLFLVMEMLDGHSLAWFLEKGARLSPRDTLLLGRRLAAGLDAVAAVGAVHRDIAPDNIFVPGDDIQKAKLIDFGLASDTFGTEKSILGTDFAGKFSFSAPEQLGLSGAKVSPKTDAYALGLVLMKIVGLPVPGEGQGIQAGAHRRTDLDIPEDRTGPALQRVLSQLLKHDPDDRPSPLTPVFEAALTELDSAAPARSETTEAAIMGAKRRADRTVGPFRASPPLIATAAGVALLLIGIGAWAVLAPSGSAPAGPSTEQAETAIATVQADDPLAEARALISEGTPDSLNAALGALLTLGRDDGRSAETRISAMILAAEMVDPETFDAARSPFPAPNPTMARQHYQIAAELGSAEALRAVNRLEE